MRPWLLLTCLLVACSTSATRGSAPPSGARPAPGPDATAGAPETTVAAKPTEPPPVKPAPPPEARRPAPPEPDKPTPPAPEPLHVSAPCKKCKIIKDPAAGTPEATVTDAFKAALDPSEDAGFYRYLELLAADEKDTPIAVAHRRQYSWKQFRKRAATYLEDVKAFAWRQVRQESPQPGHVKFFLHSSARDNPAPVTLIQEGGRWVIKSNSL